MPTTRAASNKIPSTASPSTTTTPTNSLKRTLSHDSTESDTVRSSKKSKTKMSAKDLQDLKDLISTMSKSIEHKIDESRSTLENRFTNLETQVKDDVQSIKQTVSEFQAKILHDMDSMNATLKNHADRLDNTEDDIKRVQLSQDIRLVGFAVTDNENLVEIFRKIADEIGFANGEISAMPTIERMPTKNHTTGQMMLSPTIIIHFASLRQKQSFYSLYLNKMPLDPVKFGLKSENRIVIGEHLTRKNAQLFKSAQSHRKNNKIAQTFTENGVVKIRFAKGKNEKTFTIRNNTELETLIAQYEATAHTYRANEAPPQNMDTTTSADSTHTQSIQLTSANHIQLQLQQILQQQQQQQQLHHQQILNANAAAALGHNSVASQKQ